MLTKKQKFFLNDVCEGTWTEENGVINVTGNVIMDDMGLIKIPVQFGTVNGHFICSNNKLTNLIGAPKICNGNFFCDRNQLTTLRCGPIETFGYLCSHNILTNLIGAPEYCNGTLSCEMNRLTSLKGCPLLIKGYFDCNGNRELYYLYNIGQIRSSIYYDNDNNLNKWIIECAKKNIIFPHKTTKKNIQWIKNTRQYSILLTAPQEITRYLLLIV